jgi:hypothetical protein
VIDTATNRVVSTIPVGLEPYDAIFVTATDKVAPSISCGTGPTDWSSANISIPCNANDASSGLANPADSNFVLSTNVALNVETPNAQTESHEVCDLAGNCATAGPLTFKVDRLAPYITLSAPTNSTYLLDQVVNADYSCGDGGSGLSTCQGSVASGAAVATSSVGSHVFQVSASDTVGNESTMSVGYTVTYTFSVMFDQTKAVKSGSTIPIKLRLVDANGVNVSSAATALMATSISLVGATSTTGADDSGNANPDSNFRYDAGLAGYIFNLSTKGLTIGVYRLNFVVAGESTVRSVGFVVGK